MARKSNGPEIELLLKFIDQAYKKKAWHGPTLRGSLRGVTVEVALWRPSPKHHNIWELAIHSAYWKYAVRRKLTGGLRGSFPKEGSNWFKIGNATGAAEWKRVIALLDEQHRQLREIISSMSFGQVKRLDMIMGIASHDLYHAGQIQLLKRLIRGGVVKA
jgi:hypothetical protein